MTTNNSRFLVGVVLGMAILFVAEREFSGQALSQVTGPGMNTGTSVATSTVAAAPVPTMVPLGVTPPTVTVADHPLGITYAVASLATDESGLTVPGTVSIPATGTANVCPRVSGQVVQVIVHVGQSVRAGQTLATIRSLDIATAQATLQQDQEQVHFARLALNHQLQLAHLGSFSQKPVEDARSAYTAAQATELADQNSEEQDVMSVQSDQAGAEQDETQLKQDQLDADNDQIITDREQKLYLDGIAAKEDYEAAKTTSDKDPEKLAGDKFKIDADDVKVQSDKAKVDGDLTHIKTDDIQTKIARAALDRELHVLGGDIYTAQNVESAQSTLNAAQLQVEQAVETLKIHGASETGTDGIVPVPAPISGIITARNVNPGLNVDNSTLTPWQMFTISDPSWVEVDGAVADKDLAQVKRGMPLSVRSQAYPNVIYQGRIDYIAPAIDAITHTVKVRGLLPNPGGALKDGMYVDVTVGGLSSRPVVLVPSTAVQFDPAGTFVFVPTGANSFDRKPVTLGKDRGTMTEILGGIAQGQKVVADGALLLSNGSGGGDD